MADSDGFDVLVDALWRAWGTLGINSWHRDAVDAPIDPEALIVATELVGDLRLQRETLDWGILHAHLLSPARLRALGRMSDVSAEVDGWIGTVAQHAAHVRWRATADALPDYVPSRTARAFHEVAADDDIASSVLRLRALTGTAMRADLLRALHPVALRLAAPMSTADLAERAASSTPGVLAALHDLEAAGFVLQLGTTKRRAYAPRDDHRIARSYWSLWRAMPYAPLHEALQALPFVLQLRLAANGAGGRPELDRLSDVLQAWEGHHRRISVFDTDAPHRRPSGASAQVAAEVAAVADRTLRAIAARLVAGDQPV